MTVSRIDQDPEGNSSRDILHGRLHSKSSPGDFRGGASMWRSDASPATPDVAPPAKAGLGTGAATHPFQVRQQVSGRNGNKTFIVVKNPGGKRVSTWPHQSRESAQAAADDLNIQNLIKDHADDPRPYAERRAEAESTYQRNAGLDNAGRASVDEGAPPSPAENGLDSVLDRWVQQGGSGSLSAADRQAVTDAVEAQGTPVPSKLHRGAVVPMSATTAKNVYRKGQPVDLPASSFSTSEDSALPYAEQADGGSETGVVFHLKNAKGVKGLDVSDRAWDKAGFSEGEWITAGRFKVANNPTLDDDGILHVDLTPSQPAVSTGPMTDTTPQTPDADFIEANTVRPGDYVTLEERVKHPNGSVTYRKVYGIAKLDSEGTVRVNGVNVSKDDRGYFPSWVTVDSIRKPGQFEKVARLAPMAADTDQEGSHALFARPDINGDNGVDVHSYDEFKHVIKGKTAHRWNYDKGEFEEVPVDHWLHSDKHGITRSKFPAGGDLKDEEPLPRRR